MPVLESSPIQGFCESVKIHTPNFVLCWLICRYIFLIILLSRIKLNHLKRLKRCTLVTNKVVDKFLSVWECRHIYYLEVVSLVNGTWECFTADGVLVEKVKLLLDAISSSGIAYVPRSVNCV